MWRVMVRKKIAITDLSLAHGHAIETVMHQRYIHEEFYFLITARRRMQKKNRRIIRVRRGQ